MPDPREILLQVYLASGERAHERIRGGTICSSCFEIHGRMRVRGVRSGVYDQLCACDPRPTHPDADTWWGFDFNRLVELCYCCGTAAIRSGSRWSPFFCEECKPRVRMLNESLGLPFALIPVGRHSMMNTIVAHTESIDGELAEFAVAMRSLFDRIDDLREWQRRIMQQNLQRLGLGDRRDALLKEYIERAGSFDRRLAFEELREHFL
jgi:hypothetical protein